MTLQRILTKVFISNIENSTAIQVLLEIFPWTPGDREPQVENPGEGGLGFAFDVFYVTLSFLASQSLLVLNYWQCQVLLLYFLT